MENARPFYTEFQVLKVFPIKIYMSNSPSSFIFYCFILAFTSADIIFHNFLELQSTFSYLKKDFRYIFSYLTDLLNSIPKTPSTAKIRYTW